MVVLAGRARLRRNVDSRSHHFETKLTSTRTGGNAKNRQSARMHTASSRSDAFSLVSRDGVRWPTAYASLSIAAGPVRPLIARAIARMDR
jgi:hypothetical protein